LGWSQPRRFVVLRERVREQRAAVGGRLLDAPGYTCRVLVTNTNLAPVEVWRRSNRQVCVEQRMKELKNVLVAGASCTRQFFVAEAAF